MTGRHGFEPMPATPEIVGATWPLRAAYRAPARSDGRLVAMNHDIACGFMGARFAVGKKFQNGTDWLHPPPGAYSPRLLE